MTEQDSFDSNILKRNISLSKKSKKKKFKNVKSINYLSFSQNRQSMTQKYPFNSADKHQDVSNISYCLEYNQENMQELYEQSLMKVCILGMENDRLVKLTRFLITNLEEKKKVIDDYNNLLYKKENDFTLQSSQKNKLQTLQIEIETLSKLLNDKNDENETLRIQNNNLEIKYNQLNILSQDAYNIQQELINYKNKFTQVQRERDELLKELQDQRKYFQIHQNKSEQEIQRIEQNLELVIQENDELQNLLKENSIEVEQINSFYEQEKTKNEKLQNKIKNKDSKILQLNRDKDNINDLFKQQTIKFQELQQIIQDTKFEFEILKKEKENLIQDNENLKQKNSEFVNENQRLVENYNEQNEVLKQLQRDNQKLVQQISTLNTQIQELFESYNQAEQNKNKYQQQIQQIEFQLQDLNYRYDNKQKECQKQQKEIESQEKVIIDLNKNNSLLKSDLQDLKLKNSMEMNKLQNEISQLKNQYQNIQKEKDNISNQNQKLQDDLYSIKQQLQINKQSVKDLNDYIQQQQKNLQKKDKQLKKFQEKNNKLDQDLNDLTIAYEGQQAQKDKTIYGQKNEIKKLKNEINDLNQQNEKQELQNKQQQLQIDQINQQLQQKDQYDKDLLNILYKIPSSDQTKKNIEIKSTYLDDDNNKNIQQCIALQIDQITDEIKNKNKQNQKLDELKNQYEIENKQQLQEINQYQDQIKKNIQNLNQKQFEVSNLKQTIQQLQDEIKTININNDNKIDELQNIMKDKNDDINKLQSDIDNKQDTINQLNNNIVDQKNNIQNLQTKLYDTEMKNETVLSQNKQLQKVIEQTQQKELQLKENIKEIENNIQKIKHDKELILQENQQIQQQNKDLEQQIENQQMVTKDLELYCEELEEQNLDKNNKLEDIENEVDLIGQDYQKLQEQNDDLINQNEQQEKIIQNQEIKFDQNIKEMKTLQKEFNNLEKDKLNLQLQNKSIKDQIASLQQKLHEKELFIIELNNQLQKKEAQQDKLNDDIKDYNDKLQQNKLLIDQQNLQVEELNSQIKELNEQQKQHEQQIQQTQQEIKNNEIIIIDQKTELDNYNQTITQFKNQEIQLKKQIEENKNYIIELEKEKQNIQEDFQEKIKILKDQNNKQKDQISNYQIGIQNEQLKSEKLTLDFQDIKGQLDDNINKNKDFERQVNQLQDDNLQLKQQTESIQKLEKKIKIQNQDIQKNLQEIFSLKTSIKEYKQNNEQLTNEIQESAKKAQQQSEVYDQNLKEKQQENQLLLNKNIKLKEKQQNFKIQIENQKKDFNELEQQKKQIQEDLYNNKIILNDQKQTIEDQQKELNSIKVEIKNLQFENQQIEILKNTIQQQKSQINVSDQMIVEQEEQLKEKDSQLENIQQQLTKSNQQYKNQIQQLNVNINQLESKLDFNNNLLKELQQKNEELTNQNIKLKQQLDQQQAMIEELIQENNELKDFYEPWESERNKLVLEKQRAETMNLKLQQDNAELVYLQDKLMLKIFMYSSELTRLNKKFDQLKENLNYFYNKMAEIDQLHRVSLTDTDIIEQKVSADKLVLETKMEFLKQRFYFHELIKQTDYSNHYIVEDLESPQNNDQFDNFFYLKQVIYDNKEEFEYSKNYYLKLLAYCKTPYSKNDTVNLINVFDLELEVLNYYELVFQTTYGEADRIDFTRVQKSHILNFLKSVCLLLQDLKKLQGIYHGNVFLRNIVLDDNQHLKLSGFKPIFMDKLQDGWQKEIIQEHGFYRYDIFLIGMLWLVFLGEDMSILDQKNLQFQDLKKQIASVIANIKDDEEIRMLTKFIDLDKYKKYDLEQAILEFEENQLLKNIDEKDQSSQNNPFLDQRSSNASLAKDRQSDFTLKPNLFKRGSRDFDQNDNNEMIQVKNQNLNNDANQFVFDQEFTLQQNPSVKDYKTEPNITMDELGQVKLQNIDGSNLLQLYKDDVNRRSTEPANFKKLQKLQKNSSSEKQLHTDQVEQRFSFFGKKNFDSNQQEIKEEDVQESVERVSNDFNIENNEEQQEEIQNDIGSKKQSLEEFIEDDQYTTRDKKKSVQEVKDLFNFRRDTKDKQDKGDGKIKISVSEVNHNQFYSSNSHRESIANNEIQKDQKKRESIQYSFVFGEDDNTEDNNKKTGSHKENIEDEQYIESNIQLEKDEKKIKKTKKNKSPSKSPKKLKKNKSKKKNISNNQKKKSKKNLSPQQEDSKRKNTAQQIQQLESQFSRKKKPIVIQANAFKKKNKSQKINDQRTRVDTNHIMTNVHKIKMPKKQDQNKTRDISQQKTKSFKNKKNLNKSQNKYNEYKNSSQIIKPQKKVYHNEKAPQKTQVVYTQQEKVDKLKKKALKPIDYKSRNDIFTYNNSHTVKRIPFKRILGKTKTKKKEEQKEQINEEKEQQLNNSLEEFKNLTLEGTLKLNQEQILTQEDIVNLDFDENQIQDNIEDEEIINLSLDFGKSNNLLKDDQDQTSMKEIDLKGIKEKLEQNETKRKSTVKKIPDNLRRNTKGRQVGNIMDLKPNDIENFKDVDKKGKKFEIKSYKENIVKLQQFFENEKYKDANTFLLKIINKSKGINKLDIYRILAIISYQRNELELCEFFFKKAVSYLEESDIYPKHQEKQRLLMLLATFYYKTNKYKNVIDCLKDDSFCQDQNLSLDYYFLKGDAFQKLKNYENAQNCYGQILERILNDQINQQEQEQFFKLLNRYFNVLIKQRKDPDVIKTYNIIKKHFRLQTEMSEYIEFHQYNFGKFQMDLMNLTGLKNPTLQNYFLNDQIENTPINLQNMDDQQKQDLINHYYQFALFLRSKENFLQYKNYYIKYIEECLRLNKEQTRSEQILKQRFLVMIKKSLFYLEQQFFEQAQISFDTAINIYSNLYDEQYTELIEIFFNISNSLIEVENYKESVYYLEKIVNSKSKQINHIQEQAQKNLIEVLYFLGDYNKCKKLCKIYLKDNIDVISETHKEDYFKILSFYKISCKNQTSQYDKFLQYMKTKVSKNTSNKTIEYFTFFYNANFVNFNHNQLSTNRIIFDQFLKIIKNQNKYADIYLEQISYLFAQNVLSLKKKQQDNLKIILEAINETDDIKEVKVAHILNIFKLIFFYSYHQIAYQLKIDLKKKQRKQIMETIGKIEQNNKLRKIISEKIDQLIHQYD